MANHAPRQIQKHMMAQFGFEQNGDTKAKSCIESYILQVNSEEDKTAQWKNLISLLFHDELKQKNIEDFGSYFCRYLGPDRRQSFLLLETF